MNRTNKRKKTLLPHLPEEIIIDIHSRLPPRSLSKFKCVSKPWNVLFNNPKLTCMLRNLKNNISIMLRSCNDIYSLDIYSIDNEPLSSSSSLVLDAGIEKIHCPVVLPNILKVRFVGCCNGFFCIRITSYDDFCVWSPSTGFCRGINLRELPGDNSLDSLDKSSTKVIGYGFGYDSKSDDYKFVCVTAYSESKQLEAKIYSLRLNSWSKEIRCFPFTICLGSQKYGVFCNGALHWQASCKALIAFHMTDESISIISLPFDFDLNYDPIRYKCIDVLDGSLCLLCCDPILGFQVWLMKDYGNTESWTEIYRISRPTSLEEQLLYCLTRIEIGCSKSLRFRSSMILLKVCYRNKSSATTEALVLYDPKNKTSKVLDLNDDIWSSNSLSLLSTKEKDSPSFHTFVNNAV